jgi:hypothetical protein
MIDLLHDLFKSTDTHPHKNMIRQNLPSYDDFYTHNNDSILLPHLGKSTTIDPAPEIKDQRTNSTIYRSLSRQPPTKPDVRWRHDRITDHMVGRGG